MIPTLFEQLAFGDGVSMCCCWWPKGCTGTRVQLENGIAGFLRSHPSLVKQFLLLLFLCLRKQNTTHSEEMDRKWTENDRNDTVAKTQTGRSQLPPPRLPPTAFDARFALPRPSCIPGTSHVHSLLQALSHNKFGRMLCSLAPLFSEILISRLLVFCLQRGFPEAFSKDFHVVTKLLKPIAVAKTSSKIGCVVGRSTGLSP